MASGDNWWVGLEDLDEDQQKILSASIGENHLLLGPPGSGKTNLLLLHAKYMIRSNCKNIKVLTFNRILKEFISSGTSNYEIPPETVNTYDSWIKGFLREHRLLPKITSDYNENRRIQTETALEYCNKIELRDYYKAILLDEVQDYLPNEIELIIMLCENFFAVGDFNQKIYTGEDSFSLLTKNVRPENIHTLKYHYRNGHAICKLADAISRKSKLQFNLDEYCNYDEEINKSEIKVIQKNTIDEQCHEMLLKLRVQMTIFPDEYIGIITFTNGDVDLIWKFLQKSDLSNYISRNKFSEHETISFSKKTPLIVSTIHGAKGIEFRVVHIIEVNNLGLSQRNLIYTAVTRAKTLVFIYHSLGLPPYLQQAIAECDEPCDPPKLEELF